ncbi:uncharacterized protein LOC131642974 [Vicia villosa]|uniref:uncharacterized protein LOC131642974 n=1 Tax=Vicia villosa TaxID=3911 RepID=UPI00273B5643|nr:uncharacterized protein LOC131642974 [Vicia villosa]
MSLTYIDVVYLTYLSDIACDPEYNWGAATLAYTYHLLEEGCIWKERTVAGNCTLLVAWILQHFPDIIGWGEVPGYTEDMSQRIIRQFCYQQTLPRHPYESSPIAMTRRQLDEVFVDWEHHFVPVEAQATTSETD